MANIKLTSPTGKLYKCQKAFRINKVRKSESSTDVRISDICCKRFKWRNL